MNFIRRTYSSRGGVFSFAYASGSDVFGCIMEHSMAHGTFRAGDLTAVIGDNSAHEQHRAGYNGIWSLTHRTEPTNLFVPAVAGLNFEHIFDGDHFDRDNTRTIFFEPRNAPMTFRAISETEAELH